MERLIYHVDVNSAYLSWEATEQLKNGAEIDIRQIPAIIGEIRQREKGWYWLSLFGQKIWDTNGRASDRCPEKMSGFKKLSA